MTTTIEQTDYNKVKELIAKRDSHIAAIDTVDSEIRAELAKSTASGTPKPTAAPAKEKTPRKKVEKKPAADKTEKKEKKVKLISNLEESIEKLLGELNAPVKIGKVIDSLKVTRPQASRAIGKLVDKGRVVKRGDNTNIVYSLANGAG